MDPSIIHEVNIERGEKQQAELNDWNTTTHLIYWLFGHLLWTGNSLNVWLQDDRGNLTVVWFCEQQVAPESNKTLDHPQFVSHVTFTSLCEELLLIRGGEHINFHLIYAFLIIATLYFHSTTFIWQLQLLVTFLWKKFDFSNLDRGGKYEVHQQKVTKHRRWNTAEEHNTFIKKVMAMFACFLSFVRYKYVYADTLHRKSFNWWKSGSLTTQYRTIGVSFLQVVDHQLSVLSLEGRKFGLPWLRGTKRPTRAECASFHQTLTIKGLMHHDLLHVGHVIMLIFTTCESNSD